MSSMFSTPRTPDAPPPPPKPAPLPPMPSNDTVSEAGSDVKKRELRRRGRQALLLTGGKSLGSAPTQRKTLLGG